MVDEDSFWATKEPGLYSLAQKQKESRIKELGNENPHHLSEYKQRVESSEKLRNALTHGPYPDLNKGNADLYKAFSWRFWNLLSRGGVLGAVFPRTILVSKGSALWRKEILENGDHVICAVSGKKIQLENLSYWNVELQEAYFSYVEASKKKIISTLNYNFHLL